MTRADSDDADGLATIHCRDIGEIQIRIDSAEKYLVSKIAEVFRDALFDHDLSHFARRKRFSCYAISREFVDLSADVPNPLDHPFWVIESGVLYYWAEGEQNPADRRSALLTAMKLIDSGEWPATRDQISDLVEYVRNTGVPVMASSRQVGSSAEIAVSLGSKVLRFNCLPTSEHPDKRSTANWIMQRILAESALPGPKAKEPQ